MGMKMPTSLPSGVPLRPHCMASRDHGRLRPDEDPDLLLAIALSKSLMVSPVLGASGSAGGKRGAGPG